MTDRTKEEHWFSLNLDDSVSNLTDSFESALCNKSLYLVQRTYSSQSVSGQTIYHKYRFFTPDGDLTYPAIGNCEVGSDIREGWYPVVSVTKLLGFGTGNKQLSANYYPATFYDTSNYYCKLNVCDNEEEIRTVLIGDVRRDLWPFLKSLSRASNWNEFYLLHYMDIISSEIESLHARITKYGYSKKEFAYEYCSMVGYDTSHTEKHFSLDLKRLGEAFDLALGIAPDHYLEDKEFFLQRLQSQLKYISQVLSKEKPWRK